jgi:hypothetical protein
MGSIKKRLEALTQSWNGLAAHEEHERNLRIRRTLARLVVAEHARLRKSGEGGDLVEKACLAVAHDQYDHLGEEHRETVGLAWAAEMADWGPLEWGVATGKLGAPPGWG